MFPNHQRTQDEQERLALVTDNVPAMIAYLDAGWRYRYANRRYRVFYGGSEDCIVGRRMEDVLTPQTWEADRTHVARALAGEPATYEGTRVLHDGSQRYASVSLVSDRGDAGAVLGIYVLAMDVTTQHLAKEALRESEAGLRHAEQMSGLAYIVVRPDGSYERWSESLSRIHGLEPDRVPRTTRESLELIHADDRERFRETIVQAGRSRRRTTLESRLLRGDGAIAHVRQTMEPLVGPDSGDRVRWFVTIQDVTEQKKAEERIRRLNRVYAVLSGINSAIIRIRDRAELFAEACRIAVEKGGFPFAWIGDVDRDQAVVRPAAWAGEGARSLLDSAPPALWQTGPEGQGLVWRALRENAPVVSNDVGNDPHCRMRAELAELSVHSLVVLPLMIGAAAVGVLALHAAEAGFFDEEELRLVRELADDISFALDHIEKVERVRHLAYYDSLTGLPNRSLLLERLAEHVAASRRRAEQLALVIINVDRFKIVNDTLGRQAADDLLRQVAWRLSTALGDASRVARVGADEFAVILTDVGTREQLARRLAQGVARIARQPFMLGGRELRGSFRSGVAVFPADAVDAEELFRNAEAALRKAGSGENFVFYEQQMSERNAEKLELENRLRLAVERREFVMHYQPKIDLPTRRITGAEALIRWQNPELGLVPPAKFIPMLEETGLIHQVGAWALAQAVEDQQRWYGLGLVVPRVSVNVSALELRRPDYVDGVKKALARGGAPAIDLEITESLLMENVENSVEKLRALRELGVGVAIDDFGTGYSSLGYVARLPVQALKIDRSFIVRMLDNQDALTLVSTIVSLAHALRLTVVAEGVDSDAQAKALYLLRCDEVQGYLFYKPMPFDEISALLDRHGVEVAPGLLFRP